VPLVVLAEVAPPANGRVRRSAPEVVEVLAAVPSKVRETPPTDGVVAAAVVDHGDACSSSSEATG
jgi:hypothetical protein